MNDLKHELFWKEVVVISLIAVLSLGFYNRVDKPSLYAGFVLLSLVFYFITMFEEKSSRKSKKLENYFHHTSSYFVMSFFFFVISYALITLYAMSFVFLTLSIAVILFSVGFMRLVFSKLGEK